MRLLYLSKKDRSKEMRQFVATLELLGYEVKMIWTDLYSSNDDLINEEIKVYKPDKILVHHNKALLTRIFWESIPSEIEVTWWVNDERYPIPDWIKGLVDSIDLWLVASRDTAKEINYLGGNADYLMMGFNPKKRVNFKDRKKSLVFTGQNSNNIFPLSGFRKDLVLSLKKKLGSQFEIYGKGWPFSTDSHIASGIYLDAKIGLSVGHYDTDQTYSNRVLQIMANGAMCLMHISKGVEQVFGDNVVYFDNLKECIEKYSYYLENEAERIKIAKKGFNFVNNSLSWQQKAYDLETIWKYQAIT